MTLAYYLCKAGMDVTVLEREKTIGGLARSFNYGQWCFDIGPHRFYSTNPKVNTFLSEVNRDKFLEIPRFSSVYFMNCYHDWPLKLSTVFKLPFGVSVRSGIDMLFKNFIYRNNKSCTFKDYVLQRYGKTLYNTFFKDYTEKFVGMSTENTHKNWAKTGLERATIDENVNTATLFELFKLMLMPQPDNLLFLYPSEGGIQAFWDDCAEKIKKMGGKIELGCSISEIIYKTSEDSEKKSIQEIRTADKSYPCECLYWSGSINTLAKHLNISETGLDYRAQIICNVMLDRPAEQNSQWCYYGDKDLLFSRISNPGMFAPKSVPSGKGGLCIEITCQYQDDMWNDPEKYFPKITEQLRSVRSISKDAVIEDLKMEKVREAYPIYRLDYNSRLDKFEEECGKFDNLGLLGRTGKFWYNNMDHSIENAQSQALLQLKKLEQNDKIKKVIEFLS